jgi:hypothetical protein
VLAHGVVHELAELPAPRKRARALRTSQAPSGLAVDVFAKIEMCRKHYAAYGLGAGYVQQFVR